GGSLNITGPSVSSGGYDWYPVTYNGQTGYVAGQYLTGTPGQVPQTSAPVQNPEAGQLGPGFVDPGQYPNLSYNPQGAPFYQGNTPWYYNPNTNYGGDRDWPTTPAMGGPGGYLEQNPQALFTRFISPWASGEDAFSRYVRSQFGNTMQGYEAAFANNPDLTFARFLEGLGPGFYQQRWRMMNPQQRGESANLFGGGRVQWIT